MKKRVMTIGVTITLVVSIFVGIYFINTPEYTLMKIIEDVNALGIDGLNPYLTGDAREVVDIISLVAESKIVSSIKGCLIRMII